MRVSESASGWVSECFANSCDDPCRYSVPSHRFDKKKNKILVSDRGLTQAEHDELLLKLMAEGNGLQIERAVGKLMQQFTSDVSLPHRSSDDMPVSLYSFVRANRSVYHHCLTFGLLLPFLYFSSPETRGCHSYFDHTVLCVCLLRVHCAYAYEHTHTRQEYCGPCQRRTAHAPI